MDLVRSALARSALYRHYVVDSMATAVLGDRRCARSLLLMFDATDRECLALGARKLVSLAIVAGASVVKLPQIYRIVAFGSTVGISPVSCFLELCASSMVFVYNLRMGTSFLQYGESLAAAVQVAIIIGLMGVFGSPPATAASSKLGSRPGASLANIAILSMLYAAAMSVMLSPGRMDRQRLLYLQALSIPIAAASRLPQIASLLRSRRTGQLSLSSAILTAVGSSARLFTVKHSPSSLVLLSAACSAILNWTIALLAFFYSPKPSPRFAAVGGSSVRMARKRHAA